MSLELTPLEQRVLNRIQQDFPLSPDPYGEIAQQVECTPDEAYEAVQRLRERGIIRRIGASFAAAKIGYVSVLVAARVHPDALEAAAAVAGAFPEVTHNYARDGVYNLWFTIIAENRERIEEILNAVRACAGVTAVHGLPAKRTFKIRVAFQFDGGDGYAD